MITERVSLYLASYIAVKFSQEMHGVEHGNLVSYCNVRRLAIS